MIKLTREDRYRITRVVTEAARQYVSGTYPYMWDDTMYLADHYDQRNMPEHAALVREVAHRETAVTSRKAY